MEKFTDKRSLRFRLFIEGIGVGTGVGLTIALFRFMLEESESIRLKVYELVADNDILFIPYAIFFIAAAYIIAQILKWEPMCGGGGVPQVKSVLAGNSEMKWWRVLVCRFVGCLLSIGAGMSMGRAGPSVQLGACIGQGISKKWQRTHAEERILITAGAGAGLAASFSAPLAGVVFCLEELTKIFSPAVLTASIGAAVTATAICRFFFGEAVMFNIGELSVAPLSMIVLFIVLGFLVGILALAFNHGLMASMDAYAKFKIKGIFKPAIPLVMAAVLGFVLPEILGSGNHLVDGMLENCYTLSFLLILLLGKYLYTMICCGSGVPGGIFLPMLVLGATVGAIVAQIFVGIDFMSAEFIPNMVVFGMAAYFAAVAKSPITACVLIMEITGSFHHMMTAIIVCMSAYMVSDMTDGEPIYEQLLNRSLKNKIAEKIKNN